MACDVTLVYPRAGRRIDRVCEMHTGLYYNTDLTEMAPEAVSALLHCSSLFHIRSSLYIQNQGAFPGEIYCS